MYLDTTWQWIAFIFFIQNIILEKKNSQVDYGAKCDQCVHEILPYTAIWLGFIKTS